MALIKSISGIRGTIGGRAGENLTPEDIVSSTAAYAAWLFRHGLTPRVVVGRDARPSGPIVSALVVATLQSMGIEVIDLGLSTTPTVEMAVTHHQAGGGIIFTASHNPREWNALKLLNQHGEFISAEDGAALLAIMAEGSISYAEVDALGTYAQDTEALGRHLNAIMAHPLVEPELIAANHFSVVVDGINSSGALAVPALLHRLGCSVEVINANPTGQFAHNPEPLPQHLQGLRERVAASGADLGIAVDPDVDRLALVGPGGEWIGEEYTLVTVADYVLQYRKGPTVSNLSSSRALRDITRKHGQTYHASAVGEVNVVAKMKAEKAVIGGEGNGGIIVPDLHYGRDALIGLALVLSYLARSGKSIGELRATYPDYHMVKDKVQLSPDLDVEARLAAIQEKYAEEEINTVDGVKIDFAEGWVHMRRSNTEPIVRIYAESDSPENAQALAEKLKESWK